MGKKRRSIKQNKWTSLVYDTAIRASRIKKKGPRFKKGIYGISVFCPRCYTYYEFLSTEKRVRYCLECGHITYYNNARSEQLTAYPNEYEWQYGQSTWQPFKNGRLVQRENVSSTR